MANKKFSEFELKTTTSNVSHIVGYNGAENVRITPANFLDTTGGPYLPLAGGTMVGNTIHNDGVKSIYGNPGNDLEIYHDGSNSYIKDVGSGGLRIASDLFRVYTADLSELMINAVPNDRVELYFNDSKKFETTSSGISVSSEAVVGNGTNGLQFSHSTSNSSGIINTGFSSTAVEIRTGNVQRMSINSTGATFAGEVTIDSSVATLNLEGSDSGSSRVNFGDASDSNVGRIDYDHSSNYMQFKTNDSEAMRLSAGGDLGIGGVPTVGYKLDAISSVNGYTIVGRHTSGGQIGIYNSTGDNGIGTINNYKMNFFTFNSAPQMTLDTSGNLGIGTSTPALQSGGTGLHINATTSSELKFTNNTTGSGAADGTALVSNANDFNINNRESGNITFGTSNSEKMRLTSAGYLGLGTSSPTSPSGAAGPILDLSGSNPEIAFHDTSGTANNMSMYYINNTLVWHSGSGSTGSKMTLASQNGNLLIAGTLTENSDISLKENIKPLKSKLEIISKLNPVSYNKIGQKEKELGFIAQEVEELIPELVFESKEGVKSLAYARMTAVLVKSIQELSAKLEALECQCEKK